MSGIPPLILECRTHLLSDTYGRIDLRLCYALSATLHVSKSLCLGLVDTIAFVVADLVEFLPGRNLG
jgi:hypothetical protein